MKVVDLGLISYDAALAFQLAAVDEVAAGGEPRLFLVEHPPVVTFGRHGGEEHLLLPEVALRAQGIEVVKASRGGSVTCHFPGQAVCYPVVRVAGRPGGLRGLFHLVEQAAMDVLAEYGVQAERWPGRPGVWVEGRKIASCGLALRRWVSYHGLSLNVGPDLSLFSRITACGLAGVEMTSLALELGRRKSALTADVSGVKRALGQAFRRLFPDTFA